MSRRNKKQREPQRTRRAQREEEEKATTDSRIAQIGEEEEEEEAEGNQRASDLTRFDGLGGVRRTASTSAADARGLSQTGVLVFSSLL
jgi:hypothetical protein